MRITNHESFSRYKPFNVQGYLSCNRFWRGLMDNRVPVKATLRAIKQHTFILFHAELQKDGTLYKHHRALSLCSSLNTELQARRSALLKDRIPFEWTSLKHKLKFKWKQLSKFQTRRIFTTKYNSCINNKWVLLLTDVVERMLVEKQSWVPVLRGNTYRRGNRVWLNTCALHWVNASHSNTLLCYLGFCHSPSLRSLPPPTAGFPQVLQLFHLETSRVRDRGKQCPFLFWLLHAIHHAIGPKSIENVRFMGS